ncbi:MAG: SsrA-binding protein [Chloroflexi bacterium]|jgi:SsrA-binding protein|nr:MAG: SsrA-binding protein [Chloroflexota bacterium]
MTSINSKPIAVNRKALRDYEILDTFEAGLVLKGTEIKSVRAGRVNFRDAYARTHNGEMWLFNAHIAQYEKGGIFNHEPDRPRKLLLHGRQIDHLQLELGQKGLTIVPLRMYIKNHKAKVQIGIGKGRRQYDKRKVIASRQAERDIDRYEKTGIGSR